MYNFFSFNTFITQDVLVFFYYFGAIGVPIVFFFFRNYLSKHVILFETIELKIKKFYDSFTSKEKFIFWISILFLFLMMELFWRMMFEAMIGYFDMHEYLHKISQTINKR